MKQSFSGWRVIITGGSSGIGLALSEQLAKQGAHVCILARNPERLTSATQLLRANAMDAQQLLCSVEADLASAEAVSSGIARGIEMLGGLDMLVNNAGYAVCGYIDQVDETVCNEMLSVNYLGAVRAIQAVLPHLRAQRTGHIVNVTSMLGFMGVFGYSAYAASKHALSGFTECLRQDLIPYGIQVHLCYPPTTKTPGLKRENETKPPEAWALESASKAFSAEEVAGAILRGVRRGRFHILVGIESWSIWLAQRYSPWLVRWFADRLLRKHLRQHGNGTLPAGTNG